MTKVYQKIAQTFNAYLNCKKMGNPYAREHEETIEEIVKNYLPSGSGINSGVKFNFDESKAERLIFAFGFHHMNENGYYDGWTEHKLVVTPSLQSGFDLKITGRDRNQIKEYLYEVFSEALEEKITRKNF